MRILKTEVQGWHSDDAEPEPAPLTRAAMQPHIAAAQAQTAQQQIGDLQRQLSELKEATAQDQGTQQPS